jgi:hypothetical protein
MAIINLPEEKAKKYTYVIDEDKTYFFTQVVHAYEVQQLLEQIPKEILEFIKYGGIYLIISNEFECFDDVIEEIYKTIIIANRIPENKILFLSGAVEISAISRTITEKINSLYCSAYKGVESKFFSWFEYAVAYYYKNSFRRSSSELKRHLALQGKINYQKSYLLFNNRWRLHRPTLVALLIIKKLLDEGFVSLGSNDGNFTWSNIYDSLLETNKSNSEIYNLLQYNKEFVVNTSNLILDTENKLETNYNNYNYNAVCKYYENSFMSVVTETYFYNFRTKFLTEKTFKPIAFLQPFIIVGVPFSLQVLHSMGYKTFHPFINEDYDSEVDDTKRMMLILTEIERISTLPKNELKQLSINLRDVCIHNQKLLLQKAL